MPAFQDQGLTVEVLLAAADDAVKLASAAASLASMTLVDVTDGPGWSVFPDGSTVRIVVLFTVD